MLLDRSTSSIPAGHPSPMADHGGWSPLLARAFRRRVWQQGRALLATSVAEGRQPQVKVDRCCGRRRLPPGHWRNSIATCGAAAGGLTITSSSDAAAAVASAPGTVVPAPGVISPSSSSTRAAPGAASCESSTVKKESGEPKPPEPREQSEDDGESGPPGDIGPRRT
jgi:hypothetical protein